MAVVPIISQSWDTTSYVNPTRMNNIETNISTLSKATGIEFSSGVSVKDKIDSIKGMKSLEITATSDNNGDIAMNQYSAQGITDYTKVVSIIAKSPNACSVRTYSYSNILYIRLLNAYNNTPLTSTSATLRVFIMD